MDRVFEKILTQLDVPPDLVKQAQQQQAAQGGTLRQHLIALKAFTEERFAQAVNAILRMPYVNLEERSLPDEMLTLLSRQKAEKYEALPLELDARHRRLTITMVNPTDMSALDELKFVIGYTLIPHYTPRDELTEAIQREYSRLEEQKALAAVQATLPAQPEASKFIIDTAALQAADTPIVQLIGALFTVAYARRASEILIAPNYENLRVSLRIDGKMANIAQLPKVLAPQLLSRIKRVLGFEAGERPGCFQKGSATVKLPNKKELEASYWLYPTACQEHLLMKLKDRYALPVLEDLPLEAKVRQDLEAMLALPEGMVVAAGIFRSGLTTTLYTLLKAVLVSRTHALSIENPVECMLEDVTQGQVDEESGKTYGYYLEAASHQHPEVVLIDSLFESPFMRQIFRLASGTRVLSSLRATDAANAAVRLATLTDQGMVVDQVNGIIAQRLVRKICAACREEIPLTPAHRERLGLTPDEHCYAGKGCEHCGHTGYQGLTPIFEVFPFTPDVKQVLLESGSAEDLRQLSAEARVLSLRQDGMQKVKQGFTTVQEVLRATMG